MKRNFSSNPRRNIISIILPVIFFLCSIYLLAEAYTQKNNSNKTFLWIMLGIFMILLIQRVVSYKKGIRNEKNDQS